MLGILARLTRPARRPALAAVAISAMVLPALTAPSLARGPDNIADVAEQVIDAVVNISTSQNVAGRGSSTTPAPALPNDPQLDELFRDFFNRRGGQGNQNPGGQQGGQQSQQSGNESNKDWNQRQGNNPPQGNNPSQGSDQRDRNPSQGGQNQGGQSGQGGMNR